MKELISGLKIFLFLTLMIIVIYITLQFKPNQSVGTNIAGEPLVTKATAQVYPPPQESVLSAQIEMTSDPYPMPGNFINLPQTSDCSRVGTWVEYVNKQADFSFQYPGEADIFESIDNNGFPSVTLFLKPYCYVKEWWGTREVTVAVLLNSDRLSLEEFVAEQYIFDASTDSSTISRELARFSTTIFLDKTSALQVTGTITKEVPRVYIPNNNLVIFVGLTETSNMPPFEPPCSTTLDLYNKILSSVIFPNN